MATDERVGFRVTQPLMQLAVAISGAGILGAWAWLWNTTINLSHMQAAITGIAKNAKSIDEMHERLDRHSDRLLLAEQSIKSLLDGKADIMRIIAEAIQRGEALHSDSRSALRDMDKVDDWQTNEIARLRDLGQRLREDLASGRGLRLPEPPAVMPSLKREN